MKYVVVSNYIEDLLHEVSKEENSRQGLITIDEDKQLRYRERVKITVNEFIEQSELFNKIYNYMYKPDKPLYTWRELADVLSIKYGRLIKIRKKYILKIAYDLGIFIEGC